MFVGFSALVSGFQPLTSPRFAARSSIRSAWKTRLSSFSVLVLHPRSPLSSFSRSVRLFPHQTSGSRSCCPKGHEQRGCVSRSPSGNMTCKSTLYKVFCESGLSRRSSLAADQELAGSPLPQFAFAQGVRNDFSTFSAASKPGWSSAYTENQTSAMLPSFNAT